MSAGILTKLLSRLGRGRQPRNTLSGTRELPPGGSYEALEALDEQAILMFGKRFEDLDEVAKREVMEEVMESTAKDIEFNQGGRVGMQTGGQTGGSPAYADIHNQMLQPSNQTNVQPHQSSWSPLTGSGTVQPNTGAQAVNQSGIGGALTNLIQQNPQIAEMLQGLNQQNLPGQVQNQMYTPPQPQQPWSPYVGSNPFAGSTGFYDPSTLNMPTNYSDPVMLGGPDPYQMYDPYTPSMPGAGRAQPLDTGTQPTGAPRPGYMLTPEEITEQFADTSKYSLEAQRLKSEEEARIRKEEEAKKKRVHQGGEGGAGQW